MGQLTNILERHPMIWFLLGQLFMATGLFLGFEFAVAFGYIMVGGICCTFGLSLYVLGLRERPKQSAATRLSPNFISAGSTDVSPALPNVADKQSTAQSDAG